MARVDADLCHRASRMVTLSQTLGLLPDTQITKMVSIDDNPS